MCIRGALNKRSKHFDVGSGGGVGGCVGCKALGKDLKSMFDLSVQTMRGARFERADIEGGSKFLVHQNL